jgi:hypothetical protein
MTTTEQWWVIRNKADRTYWGGLGRGWVASDDDAEVYVEAEREDVALPADGEWEKC